MISGSIAPPGIPIDDRSRNPFRTEQPMTTPPFIVHILVADGDPDGLRVVERGN